MNEQQKIQQAAGYLADRDSWWRQGEDYQLVNSLFDTLVQIFQDQDHREQANLTHMRLFSNRLLDGFNAASYLTSNNLGLSFNVVRNVVGTVCSHIGAERPRVKFATKGGRYSDRRKAEQLTYFCDGQFLESKVYQKARRSFKDCSIFGDGYLKIFRKDREIRVERIFPNDIWADPAEWKYGNGKTVYIHTEAPISNLIAMYPEKAPDLEASSLAIDNAPLGLSTNVKLCSVVESWRLPVGNEPGRHIIATNRCKLFDEEWKQKRFPIARINWDEDGLGFYNTGLPEILKGIQLEINQILRKMSRLMRLASSKVFLNAGSKVNKQQLDNTEWGIVDYHGNVPPVFATVQAFSPEAALQLERLYNRAYELAGISQMAATSQKEPGIDAAKAMREMQHVQSNRFKHVELSYQEFFIDIAQLMIDCAKEISSEDPDYSVTTLHDGQLKTINWADIDLEEDRFLIQPHPVPLFTGSIGGQLQTVLELTELAPEMRFSLLDNLEHPDIKAIMAEMNANTRLIDRIIEDILEGNDYYAPEPFFASPPMINRVRIAYIQACQNGEPEETLEKFRVWMNQALEMITPPKIEQSPAPMLGQQQLPQPAQGPQAPEILPPAQMPAGQLPQ